MIVDFLPAYLHKSEGCPGLDSGTGWVQDARLIFAEGSFSGGFPDLPCGVMNGYLVVDGVHKDNLIPVPLEMIGSTELCLTFDSIHTVTVNGRGVRLELVGEPEYVEEFEP